MFGNVQSSANDLRKTCLCLIVWQKKRVLQEAALSLLRSDNTVFDKALVLCQMHNFKEGVLYLYEKGMLCVIVFPLTVLKVNCVGLQ